MHKYLFLLFLLITISCEPDKSLAKKNIEDFIRRESTDIPDNYQMIKMEPLEKVSEEEIGDLSYEKYSDTVNLGKIRYKVRCKYKERILVRDGYLPYKGIDIFYLDKNLNIAFVKHESLKSDLN